MRITILLFMIVLSVNVAYAATYYVDALSGSDTNNGLSTSTAWKTVGHVNAHSFLPGDNILFKRGQIWRETLIVPSSGNPSNYITFGDFSAGDNPIISGSDIISSGWTRYAVHVWMSTVSTQPNIVYFNDVRGNMKTSIAGIASEYDWFWSSNVLYVYSPTDIDPNTYYTNPGIEAGSRSRVLDTNSKSYVIIDGLNIRDGNGAADNTVNVGTSSVIGIVFQNCVVERGNYVGIEIKGSTTADSITINNCTIRNNGNEGIFIAHPYNQGEISNSTIEGNGWGAIRDLTVPAGIEGYLGNFDILGNSIFSNAPVCHSTNVECHGIYVDGSSIAVNIHKNIIYSNTYGSGIKTRGSANIYQNKLYNNYGTGVELGGNGATNIVVSIYDNLIYNNDVSDLMGGVSEGAKGTGTLRFSLLNNLFYWNGGSHGEELTINDALTSLTIENNIFFTNGDRHTVVIASQSGPTTIDYNIHWRADGNPSIYYGGSGRTWSQWQGLGFDQHGLNQDPYLVNPSGGDFSLQNNSPAIDAGVDVGLTSDYFGNPIVGIPDIGAIEYDSGQYNPADTNHDGCVSLGEISSYVALWLQGQVTLGQISGSVDVWLQGC